MPAARILIVEDETIVAMDIAATLRRLGFEIAGMAESGPAAIEAARTTGPDLILMDIHLKGDMDGIEAASIIRAHDGTPVLFLTAHGDLETVERAKSGSPHGYVVKPFDERVLHRTIEVALHRHAAEKSAREQVLDALWHSEERFRFLVEAVKDYALFMLDTEGRIASWNPGAERVTGFTADDAIGKPLTILQMPFDGKDEDVARLLDQVRADGGSEWEQVATKKDGSRYTVEISCTPMRNRSGDLLGYVSVARDVSEQRSLQAQIAQAQKLESLGQLAGGVAHDFNNMLMVIFARCDLLMRTLESPKERKYVEDIRAAARKNRDLTQQLLAAARQQVLDSEVVDLNRVIGSAMELLGPTLGENITIEEQLQEPLWSVHADPGKIHQVLVNLAINARDAMPRGGTLGIGSRNVHVDAHYSNQHFGLRQGEYVSLVVSDTGVGIPAEIRDRIYDPFFTTKGPGRGTGLGLAVVRGIVEQNGGLIWMYSEEGRGTTFKIFFPRHGDAPAADAVIEDPGTARGTETILLVEDEELLRAVLAETLEDHGYRVLEARIPEEAIALSDAFGGRIDLLLTDMIMPGMTGRDLAAVIVSRRPGTPVVYMSGYSNSTFINGGIEGDMRYLEKPVSAPVVLRAIREVLDKARTNGA